MSKQIVEYNVVLYNKLTDEESPGIMAIDLLNVESMRPSVDDEGRTIVAFKSNDSVVVVADYEDLLTDWEDARDTTIVRVDKIHF